VKGWPAGLLVVGDALCAFNPAYGQGITVAAIQAEELRRSLRRSVSLDARATRRLLRGLERRAGTAWNIATLVDRTFLSPDRTPDPVERWIGTLEDLARHGDTRAAHVLQRSYHLLGKPVEFLHPALAASAVRARLRGPGSPNPRPPELDLVSAGARDGTEPGPGRPRTPEPGPRGSRSAGRAASPDR
jgi:2-polyprenyl-6-methoxyphenol hydroxylase-like FAD-dependent oxidoreductase